MTLNRITLGAALFGALTLALGAFKINSLSQQLDDANVALGRSQSDLRAASEQLALARQAVTDRDALQAALGKVQGEIAALETELRRRNAAFNNQLKGLIDHDQATRDWLSGAVPDALGLLYQRTETLDPAGYREPPVSGVQSGSVPAAGAGTAKDQ